jgi:hypothetical protein
MDPRDPVDSSTKTKETAASKYDGPGLDPRNPDNTPAGHYLLDAEYNPDGSIKNPILSERDQGPEEGKNREGEDLGPEGMPATNAADGPWATDVIPTGWSRFPTEEEVSYLNGKYPQQPGAPYQPGGHGIEEDKTALDASKDRGASVPAKTSTTGASSDNGSASKTTVSKTTASKS